jgi:hypothetical protein
MLIVSGLGSGGSPVPPPITSAAAFLVYFMKGGNDATGNGTDDYPYLTATKALSVANSYAPTSAQPALVVGGPGTFTENPAIPPNVYLVGIDAGGRSTIIDGTLDLSAAWAVSAGATGGASAISVVSDITIDLTGAANSFLTFSEVSGEGNLTLIGDPATGGVVQLVNDCNVSGATAFQGLTVGSASSVLGGTVLLASTAAQPAVWFAAGDRIGEAAVTLDATAGQNVSATMTGAVVSVGLVLHDGGGGVTSYTATAEGIPATVTLLGGAAYPVRSTDPNAINAGAAGQVITTQLVGGQLVAVWAAAGGGVTWADDLSTSTNTDQWVSAISGGSGLGGAVPLGTNVTLTAEAGGRSAIDLTGANPAFGFLSGYRMLSPIFDTATAVPMLMAPVEATRMDFLSSPSFRMANAAFFTGVGVNLQIGTLALATADAGSGLGVLALHIASLDPSTVPNATGVIWEDSAGGGLHYTGPAGLGSTLFDEMIVPTWGVTPANTQVSTRVKFGGFVRTVGVGPFDIMSPIPVPVADSVANVRYELVGRVIVPPAAGGAVGDAQAMTVYQAYKNVAGVLSQPGTIVATIGESQYDAAIMNPATTGIVTSPISGTNLQYQITGVATATIDWTMEADVLYN